MPNVTYLPAAMAALASGCLLYDLLRPMVAGGGRSPLRMLRPVARDRQPGVVAGAQERRLAEAQARVAELEGLIQRLRRAGHSMVEQRDAARAEAASLRLALGTTQQEMSQLRQRLQLQGLAGEVLAAERPPPDRAEGGRFRSAKLAFARLYHPDNAQGSDMERALRTHVFKEFWAELERIEKG